jgi:hypothetical protein
MVHEQRVSLLEQQPVYRELVERGFSLRTAELAKKHREIAGQVRDGEERLRGRLIKIRALQQEVGQRARDALAAIAREPELVACDEITFLVHALVLPLDSAHEVEEKR